MEHYTVEDFNFTVGTPVCSNAQKFIIPVPNFGNTGEPLIYPTGTFKNGEDISGQPITDYMGQPIGELGIVFPNPVDGTVQAAPGDGNTIIIINGVTREQAKTITEEVAEYAEDPESLTLDELKQILLFAASLGLNDQYNSDRGFARKNLSPVDSSNENMNPYFGHKKRDARDLCHAFYVPGQFKFAGPAATPQLFDDGGIILKHGDNVRGIQPNEFQSTYMFAGGGLITDAKSQISTFASTTR